MIQGTISHTCCSMLDLLLPPNMLDVKPGTTNAFLAELCKVVGDKQKGSSGIAFKLALAVKVAAQAQGKGKAA